MLPIGHTEYVHSAFFSPDGKYIVTASVDATAKVWNALSGQLEADLKGHIQDVYSASFSPDGKYIVTASLDHTAKVWNTFTWQLVADLKGHTSGVYSASFSPDGKYIVTSSKDNTAKVWNVLTGQLIADLKGHTNWVIRPSFSPACPNDPKGGKYIVTSSWDGTARVWNALSGQLVAEIKGHTNWVLSAKFSPDGKYIVTASRDSTAKVWNALNGQLLANLKGHKRFVWEASFSPDGKYIVTASWDSTAKVWNALNGQLVADLKGHSNRLYSASFSPDGKYIVTASKDSTAKVWNVRNGQLEATLKGHTNEVEYASFSPDGKYIVTASDDYTARVWNTLGGQLVADLKGHTRFLWDASFSPDGKYIVTAAEDNLVQVWNVQSGHIVANLKGHTRFAWKASFSPACPDDPGGGKYIVTTSGDYTAKVWNAQSGQLVSDLTGHANWVLNASFSPDGKYIVTASKDSKAKVWNALSGQLIADLKGHNRDVQSAFFSPGCPDDPGGGKYIVTASLDSTARVWNAQSGELVAELKGHTNSVNSASFSPDGKYIVTVSWDSTAKVWNAQTGQLVADLKGHTSRVNSAFFSPDGKFIVTASNDRTARVWNVLTWEIVAELKGHMDLVYSAVFSPDGKYIVTSSQDRTAKVWNASSGQLIKNIEGGESYFEKIDFINNRIISVDIGEVSIHDMETAKKLYTFFAVDSSDYLIIDKYNHYDGTSGARKLLYYKCGNENIELQQLKDKLWVPGLAERINKGETINAPTLSELEICGLIPEVEDIGREGIYKFKITPQRGGLGETVLFINNTETKRYAPGQLKKTATGYELTISKDMLQPYLVAGQQNLVTLKSYTAKNDIISRGVIITVNKTKKEIKDPNLYAVIVGVSDYKSTELHLNYAAKDAQDMTNAIGVSARKLLNKPGSEHVFIYNFNTGKERSGYPDKKSIQLVFDSIAKKATANDILLVFFAGHGTVASDRDNKKQFYFLSSDASSFTNPAESGISTKELIEWIHPKNIKAQKRILILDACNSGQAINDISENKELMAVRNTDAGDEKKEIERLNDQAGMFILSASASTQSAYELGRYSQGLLTYTLLKAIKQQPDILEENKYLNLSRWFSAAKRSVSDIMNQMGNSGRQEPQLVANTNFNIGIVDDEVMAKIVLPMEKPLFAASNFQNSDEAADGDNLELSKLINLKLNEISTRGTESRIVYVMGTNSPDAYTIGGRYDVKGNDITVRISIRQHKEVKQRFEIIGTKDKLNELAAAIADKAAGIVNY